MTKKKVHNFGNWGCTIQTFSQFEEIKKNSISSFEIIKTCLIYHLEKLENNRQKFIMYLDFCILNSSKIVIRLIY